MNPCQLTVAVSALAASITQNLCDEDAALLSAVLTQLADSMNTILAARACCAKAQEAADAQKDTTAAEAQAEAKKTSDATKDAKKTTGKKPPKTV